MNERRTGSTPLRGVPLDDDGRIAFEPLQHEEDVRELRERHTALRAALAKLEQEMRAESDTDDADGNIQAASTSDHWADKIAALLTEHA